MALCLPNNLPPDVWVGDTITRLILEESDRRPSPVSDPASWGRSPVYTLPLSLVTGLKERSWTLGSTVR